MIDRPLRRRLWESTRSATVAIALGFAVLVVGGSASGAVMFANLKLAIATAAAVPAFRQLARTMRMERAGTQ